MSDSNNTAIILDAIKTQGDHFSRRMDSQQREIKEVKDVVVQLARIEERQVAHDESSKAQVNRIYARIDENTHDIEIIQTELSENRWISRLFNSLITKLFLGAGTVSALAAGGYKVIGG